MNPIHHTDFVRLIKDFESHCDQLSDLGAKNEEVEKLRRDEALKKHFESDECRKERKKAFPKTPAKIGDEKSFLTIEKLVNLSLRYPFSETSSKELYAGTELTDKDYREVEKEHERLKEKEELEHLKIKAELGELLARSVQNNLLDELTSILEKVKISADYRFDFEQIYTEGKSDIQLIYFHYFLHVWNKEEIPDHMKLSSYIHEEYEIDVSVKTVGKHLKKLGFTL